MLLITEPLLVDGVMLNVPIAEIGTEAFNLKDLLYVPDVLDA
jgi:hypothetical protein